MQKLMLITHRAMIVGEANSVICVFRIMKLNGCSANRSKLRNGPALAPLLSANVTDHFPPFLLLEEPVLRRKSVIP